MNNDGIVNNIDATLIKRAVGGLAGGVATLPGFVIPGIICDGEIEPRKFGLSSEKER